MVHAPKHMRTYSVTGWRTGSASLSTEKKEKKSKSQSYWVHNVFLQRTQTLGFNEMIIMKTYAVTKTFRSKRWTAAAAAAAVGHFNHQDLVGANSENKLKNVKMTNYSAGWSCESRSWNPETACDSAKWLNKLGFCTKSCGSQQPPTFEVLAVQRRAISALGRFNTSAPPCRPNKAGWCVSPAQKSLRHAASEI